MARQYTNRDPADRRDFLILRINTINRGWQAKWEGLRLAAAVGPAPPSVLLPLRLFFSCGRKYIRRLYEGVIHTGLLTRSGCPLSM
jgi:hypothetical protein